MPDDIKLPALPEPQGFIPRKTASGEVVEIGAITQYAAVEFARAAVLVYRQEWQQEMNLLRMDVLGHQSSEMHLSGLVDQLRAMLGTAIDAMHALRKAVEPDHDWPEESSVLPNESLDKLQLEKEGGLLTATAAKQARVAALADRESNDG